MAKAQTPHPLEAQLSINGKSLTRELLTGKHLPFPLLSYLVFACHGEA